MTSRKKSQEPRPRTARDTRVRILEAARHELSRNPDIPLAHIARVAGAARRTVYRHFTSRAALVEGLAEEAGAAIRRAVADTPDADGSDSVTALARFALTLWPVGDRYRMLIGLAHHGPDAVEVDELLAPARDTAARILTRGQQQGVFHASIPCGPLGRALEAHMIALLGSVNSGLWADDGVGAATSLLIAAGVEPDVAAWTICRL